MALPTLSGLTKSIYGKNQSNAVSHSIAQVLATDLVRENKLAAIAAKAILERERRGGSAISLPGGYFSGQIAASRVQDIITVVDIAGPDASEAYNGANQNLNSGDGQIVTGSTPITDAYGNVVGSTPTYAPVPQPVVVTYPKSPAPSIGTSFSRGQRISSADINTMITGINNAGAVCTCNCNYCTCNCNYCTCNCNYSCTCNCNYSDETLKANVEYM